VVHADSDQLHEFPINNVPLFLKMVENTGYDSVYGYYIDRVAEDGIIPNITTVPSIDEQFPLSCHMSTQIVRLNRYNNALNIPSKVMAFKGYLQENNGGGMVQNENEACVYPVRLRTHHFKWTWAVIRKMEMRSELEKFTNWGYQSINVLNHLKNNHGKINITDEKLKCRKMAEIYDTPVSAIPVDRCARHKQLDKDLQNIS
jgi:hypothetical protein